MTDGRRRNGFVLFLAILAVVVVAALIVAVHAALALEHATAAGAVARQRAFAASEHGLWYSVANWNAANDALPYGGSTTTIVRAAGDSATVTTVRLNAELYWLVAEAVVGSDRRRARRRTAVNVRVVSDSAGVEVSPVRRSWVELH